jgi:hypothetical protein
MVIDRGSASETRVPLKDEDPVAGTGIERPGDQAAKSGSDHDRVEFTGRGGVPQ